MLSDGFNIAIHLLEPMGKLGFLSKMLNLIDKTTAPATAIGFLKGGYIEVLQYISNTV